MSSENEESKAGTVISFRAPKDVVEWLDERKKEGESPAKIIMKLLRQEMETYESADSTEHEKQTRDMIDESKKAVSLYEMVVSELPISITSKPESSITVSPVAISTQERYRIETDLGYELGYVVVVKGDHARETMTQKELNKRIEDHRKRLRQSRKSCLVCGKPRLHPM